MVQSLEWKCSEHYLHQLDPSINFSGENGLGMGISPAKRFELGLQHSQQRTDRNVTESIVLGPGWCLVKPKGRMKRRWKTFAPQRSNTYKYRQALTSRVRQKLYKA